MHLKLAAHKRRRRLPRPLGFSLVELMVVIAIAALVLATGVPGFIGMVQGQRLTATVNDFLGALHLARSEAIQRGRPVSLVPAGEAAGWTTGWIVFVDEDGNLRRDAREELISSHGPIPTGISVKASFTDMTVPYISYQPNGRTRTRVDSMAPQFGNMQFAFNGQARKIVINMLGRVRTCNPVRDGPAC